METGQEAAVNVRTRGLWNSQGPVLDPTQTAMLHEAAKVGFWSCEFQAPARQFCTHSPISFFRPLFAVKLLGSRRWACRLTSVYVCLLARP